MKTILAILIGSLTLAAHAADQKDSPPAATKDNFFVRAAKVIGHDAKTGAHEAGQDLSQTGKDIGHGTSKAVKEIGEGMKESAKRTAKAAKDTVK
jgi:hypothetical protein